MPGTNDSANGRPPAHPDPDRSSNAQAAPEHAQARDGVLTARARRLTARRLEHALASPDLKPSTLEVAPGVTYRARGVTSQLARLVRDAIEDGYLDGYGVTNATAVVPWATAHLTADLAREVRRRRLGRELTGEEADRAALRPLRSKVGAAVTYLAATGAYAYCPGDGHRAAQLAYAPAVLEEVTPLTRSSRGGGHPPWGEGGVTPRGVTRSRSSSVEKSPATRSSERERRNAQAAPVVTSTTERPTSRSVSSTSTDTYLDAIASNLEGTRALTVLEAERWREDAGLRRAVARLAAQASNLDPSRVVTRLDLRGERNLTGERWNAERVTERVAIVASNYGAEAVAAVLADDRRRERDALEAVEREAASREATATATPMPEWLRARALRPRSSDAQATPEHAPTPLEHAPTVEPAHLEASAPPELTRHRELEHAATVRELSDGELAELERSTLATIAAYERPPAYLLDPPYRDRVLEHAVAPSPTLDRAQALAAFAQLLDTRRRHATPPPGDTVLAALEHRLGRTLTLSELDLLDALPVTLTAPDAATLDAWAASELTLTASTGRP